MERDTVTGLNLAVERVENPGTGRWDTQDPLGFWAGDSDLYRYVGNAPTEASDPWGLADGQLPIDPHGRISPTVAPPEHPKPEWPVGVEVDIVELWEWIEWNRKYRKEHPGCPPSEPWRKNPKKPVKIKPKEPPGYRPPEARNFD